MARTGNYRYWVLPASRLRFRERLGYVPGIDREFMTQRGWIEADYDLYVRYGRQWQADHTSDKPKDTTTISPQKLSDVARTLSGKAGTLWYRTHEEYAGRSRPTDLQEGARLALKASDLLLATAHYFEVVEQNEREQHHETTT